MASARPTALLRTSLAAAAAPLMLALAEPAEKVLRKDVGTQVASETTRELVPSGPAASTISWSGTRSS